MGWYIQGPALGKAQFIVSEYDGKIIPCPKLFSEVPQDKALVCVVKNRLFDAAAYCFSEHEFEAFTEPGDPRPKTWLLVDKAKRFTNSQDMPSLLQRRKIREIVVDTHSFM
jgi:hypothetical protein